MKKGRRLWLLLGFISVFSMQVLAEEARHPEVSIKEMMESVITPATNILWEAEDPQTEEEWRTLENAAITIITAAAAMELGGSGPQDAIWVQEPAWRSFSRIMTDAAVASLEAARSKDIDALLEAGYVLYPPCEACHRQYNPGVINQ